MICYSGGAIGADTVFEQECISKGITVVAFTFKGHKTTTKNEYILSQEKLNKGFEHVTIANKTLKRNIYNISWYVKSLLSRNWFQVRLSDAVFAVANLNEDMTIVLGGTGWCVMMAIDNHKPVFVFDQKTELWFEYDYIIGCFKPMDVGDIPKLTSKFAGVGSRKLTEAGVLAIKKLFNM
jgi:hypothetical protein